MKFLFRLVINALALLGIAYIVPGVEVVSLSSALLFAFLLGLANAIVRPLLFILTLPITVLTLGLFIFVLNALMLWLVSSLVPGVTFTGFLPALVTAFLLWIVSMMSSWLIKQSGE